MRSVTISARVPAKLQEQVAEIAKVERRKISNVVVLALEEFVREYNELHPQFREDILEGLREMDEGKATAYERG